MSATATADPRRRAQLLVAAIDFEAERDHLAELYGRYPDMPPDVRLRVEGMVSDLHRVVNRLIEAAEHVPAAKGRVRPARYDAEVGGWEPRT